jgi:glycine/D-amino acid oxidase-like deaminating enzyme
MIRGGAVAGRPDPILIVGGGLGGAAAALAFARNGFAVPEARGAAA